MNPEGYIGESTQNEINLAKSLGFSTEPIIHKFFIFGFLSFCYGGSTLYE